MGFSFRGKASDRPPLSDGDVSPIEAVSVNPEADLKRFKTLHKWDPFMEIDKLDAADESVFLLYVLLCDNVSTRVRVSRADAAAASSALATWKKRPL